MPSMRLSISKDQEGLRAPTSRYSLKSTGIFLGIRSLVSSKSPSRLRPRRKVLMKYWGVALVWSLTSGHSTSAASSTTPTTPMSKSNRRR